MRIHLGICEFMGLTGIISQLQLSTKSTNHVGYFIMSDASGRVLVDFKWETLNWVGVSEVDILIDGFIRF